MFRSFNTPTTVIRASSARIFLVTRKFSALFTQISPDLSVDGPRAIPGGRHSQVTRRVLAAPRIADIILRTVSSNSTSSPFDPDNIKRSEAISKTSGSNQETAARRQLRKFIPRKAAVQLTPSARSIFQQLLKDPPRPDIVGVLLHYGQSKSGEPRMVFSFEFVTKEQLEPEAEGVSLEVMADGTTPKPPEDAWEDGLPKLYVHPNAFLKVLGATVDVDAKTMTPVLYDRAGNKMDPNV